MNDVAKWLTEGAGVREGLRLLAVYEPNPYLACMVEANPQMFGYLLEGVLHKYAEGLPVSTPPVRRRQEGSFREEWPFLSRADCPQELKVLAADKITAYHNTLDLHEKLFYCDSPEDCYETAKNLLENFTQNRLITAEFAYYKEHGTVLGKHPVFSEARKFAAIRRMSIVGLIAEARRLEGAIWRIGSELAKKDKPHLDEQRRDRLARKQRELDVVREMIAEYEKNKK